MSKKGNPCYVLFTNIQIKLIMVSFNIQCGQILVFVDRNLAGAALVPGGYQGINLSEKGP